MLAEGELQASVKLADAAEIIQRKPMAMHIRGGGRLVLMEEVEDAAP